MKNFLAGISKGSITSIIALLFIVVWASINLICLYHGVPDKDIAIMILTNSYGLTGFVAGYYFNKKETEKKS